MSRRAVGEVDAYGVDDGVAAVGDVGPRGGYGVLVRNGWWRQTGNRHGPGRARGARSAGRPSRNDRGQFARRVHSGRLDQRRARTDRDGSAISHDNAACSANAISGAKPANVTRLSSSSIGMASDQP